MPANPPPPLFTPFALRGVTLKSRIVLSAMSMYSATDAGEATDWHLVHYGSRAMGGAALVMQEATAVQRNGRYSEGDLCLYDDRHISGLSRIVDFIHRAGAKAGIQLCHAGRKAFYSQNGYGPEETVGASAVPYDEGWRAPRPLTRGEIDDLVAAYQSAAARAAQAGYDILELHCGHGYLLHQFLSPLSNRRDDEYGGSPDNRFRLIRRVLEAVRAAWPADKPLMARISATEYVPGGLDVDDMLPIARQMASLGVDAFDVSSGGIVPFRPEVGPGYQVPYAEAIRARAGLPTAAVGFITTPQQANDIIQRGRADLVVLGRELLRRPYWPLEAAHALGYEIEWPAQYRLARLPRNPAGPSAVR